MSKLSGRLGLTLAGGVGVALLLTGCGSTPSGDGTVTAHTGDQRSGRSSSSGTASGTDSAPSAGRSSDGTSTSGGSASSGSSGSASGPAQCSTAQLDAAVQQGDSAAGSAYYTIVLTNTGDQPCSTGGFGGVSLVGHGDGSQIGAPARRDEQTKAHTIALQPGEKAAATLQVASVDNYGHAQCKPTPADGLRIYPPNNTASLFAKAADLTGCANPKLEVLTLSPYQPVQ